jgi:type IV pilus assembly protein PilM
LLPLIDLDSSEQEWAMQEAVDPFGRDIAWGFSEEELAAHHLELRIEAEAIAEAAAEARRADQMAGGAVHGYVREVTQAVNVAAAYFEDTLERSPGTVLSAGSTSAQSLRAMLTDAGFGEGPEKNGSGGGGMRVRELVESDALVAQAVSATVPKGWLAGVRGALRS